MSIILLKISLLTSFLIILITILIVMQSFFVLCSQIVAKIDLKLVFIMFKIFFLISIALIKSDYYG